MTGLADKARWVIVQRPAMLSISVHWLHYKPSGALCRGKEETLFWIARREVIAEKKDFHFFAGSLFIMLHP